MLHRMSYCRLSEGDVYMYDASDSVECCMCAFGEDRSFTTRSEALAHLRDHQGAGDRVPEYAIRRLEMEIEHVSNDVRSNPWDSLAFKEAWGKWCDENKPWGKFLEV